MSADIYDRYIEVCHRSNEQADEIRRLTTERDALRGEVERLRLAADMLHRATFGGAIGTEKRR